MGLLTRFLRQGVSGLLGSDNVPQQRKPVAAPPPDPAATTMRVMGLPAVPFPFRPSTPRPVAPRPQRPQPQGPQPPHSQEARPAPPALSPGVDWHFVADEEGDGTRAYVPSANGAPDTNSGVTVAHGFDLGGRDIDNLRGLGLPEQFVTALTPYLGRRGADAATYLQDNPLRITEDQQRELDPYVFNDTYRQIRDDFNRDAANGLVFEELPAEAQTVIADVAHQYGPGLARRTPNFWRDVTTGAWDDAVSELRNFGDAQGPRRRREANRLQQGIERGAFQRDRRD